jgi:hypothetical protein
MWFNMILIILFLVKNLTSLVKHSTLLYTINLVLFALGEYMNPITSIYRIRLISLFNIYE